MNTIAIVSLVTFALAQLTGGTVVPLKDGSGTQIARLEDEIGDALLALRRLQGHFQGGLRDGQFKSTWLVARTVNETVEMLQNVSNLTESLLQHSQFQQYRTITSAIRIINNTSARLILELGRVLPVVSAGGKFNSRVQGKLSSVKEIIDVSYGLIKQYFEIMIAKS